MQIYNFYVPTWTGFENVKGLTVGKVNQFRIEIDHIKYKNNKIFQNILKRKRKLRWKNYPSNIYAFLLSVRKILKTKRKTEKGRKMLVK